MTRPPLPEWAPHQAVWIGFPSDPELWLADLKPAEREVAAFAEAVHAGGKGEAVRLVAAHDDAARAAHALCPFAEIVVEPFGDIWLRDTGPIIVGSGKGRVAVDFAFNGWGGKYELPGDEDVGARIAAAAGLPVERRGWILEGGAIDGDGSGTVLTTEQCLLNPNRNRLGRDEVEQRLLADLGFERILWLGDGLLGDHTDGHVDNLARFVAPGTLAIPLPSGPDDPNAAVYADARARALAFGLTVRDVPSPGRLDEAGIVEPASYMNFAIANKVVVVPTYGSYRDGDALAAIGELFPGRAVVGVPSQAVLTGGGSFHCSSQHVPAG